MGAPFGGDRAVRRQGLAEEILFADRRGPEDLRLRPLLGGQPGPIPPSTSVSLEGGGAVATRARPDPGVAASDWQSK